ncbi:hypothetical protein PRNP1_007739 [Phytophthora ramorum]
MKWRRLSLDTLHVARLPLSMLIEPAVRPRPKGDFVDANVSGGKLLTYKEMKAAVKMKVAAAEAKKQVKQEAAAARAARKVETAARKAARQQAAATGRLKRQVAAQQKKAVASGRRCRAQLAGFALTQGPVALDQNSVVAFADVYTCILNTSEDGAHERDPHGGQAAAAMVVLLLGFTAFHDYMAKPDRFEENDQDAPEIQEQKI